ncbi:isochorismate synthase [Puteibacter caeruleilacunae]|nr:isochorismate synthase [Puteibacter caeruleilacunae]
MKEFVDKIDVLLDAGCPFALYFYPGSQKPELVFQENRTLETVNSIHQLDGKKAFVMAPFHVSEDEPIICIEPDEVLHGYKSIMQFKVPVDVKLDNQWEEISALSGGQSEEKEEYTQKIESLVQDIQQGKFAKVVFARSIEETFNPNCQLGNLLLELKKKADQAFVYMVNLPGRAVWVGATPEIILEKQGDWLKTVALAGTIDAQNNQSEWSDKEIKEQQFVVDFVRDQLRKNGVERYKASERETVIAGNVAHLKTNFVFSEVDLKNDLVALLEDLHPTPAVCGLPKEDARDYILDREVHNRAYYSGFIGPWYVSDDACRLFVNLRCMKLTRGNAQIFVGGGITAGSDAAREWRETELKATNLQLVLKKYGSENII